MSDEIPRPVRPRDAASVVLICGKGAKSEVLMGRRRKRASFLPNVYVFPGGRVDAADRRAVEGLALDPETERHLRRHTPATSALALALAGLREIHEETGYLISRDADTTTLEDAWRRRSGMRCAKKAPSPTSRAWITSPGR